MSHPLGPVQQQLITALRSLREAAGLSTYSLAKAMGTSQSKITKVENGRTSPSVDDVEAWAAATGADPAAVADLADLAYAAATEAKSWWSTLRGGRAARQREMGELEATITALSSFQPVAVPGLLQTPEYARRVLALADLTGQSDLDAAAAARMSRQAVLLDTGKRFRYVLTEGALRWRPGPPELMNAQVERLLATAALPNVRVGIIPFDREATAVYANAFAIFEVPGAPVVLVENYTNEVFLHEKRDIGAYSAIFARLEGSALFDEAAADFAMSLNR